MRRARRGRTGFTLVEVIVALVLLELLLLGTLALLHRAAAGSARAVVTERAVWEASALADSALGGFGAARPWGSLTGDRTRVVALDSAGDTLVALTRSGHR